jgi:hypothetical protein
MIFFLASYAGANSVVNAAQNIAQHSIENNTQKQE